jgi:ubiquinol-cytochrome c reductase iron-sulfur subunit
VCVWLRDPHGIPIKASEVTIGSAFHVVPDGYGDLRSTAWRRKAKAAVC